MLRARTRPTSPRLHKLGNWGFVKLSNLLFGTHFSDITYGYNAVWRQHRDKLAPEIDGWAHEIVGNIRAVRNGLRVVEVACREYPRLSGEPKLKTFSAGWVILCAIVAERFRSVPAHEPVTERPAAAASAWAAATLSPPVQLRLIDIPGWWEQAEALRPVVTDAVPALVPTNGSVGPGDLIVNHEVPAIGARVAAVLPIQPELVAIPILPNDMNGAEEQDLVAASN